MDKDDIADLRALPLEVVLQNLGATRDPKDPRHNWRIGASRITVTDSVFYDHNGAGALHRMREGRAGGGGAIDLVQYIKDVGFREAVRELGGFERASPPVPGGPRASPASAVVERPPPTPSTDRASRVEWYLTEVRRIPGAIVRETMATGEVFADARGNAVFRLKDEGGREVGYEVRGTCDKPYHSVYGEKGVFITKADTARRAVFVESAIEALSYRALGHSGLVVSTTGSAVDRPMTLARAFQGRGYDIVLAFNADGPGDLMASRMQGLLEGKAVRQRPAMAGGKDWNDELRGRALAQHEPDAMAPSSHRSVETR